MTVEQPTPPREPTVPVLQHNPWAPGPVSAAPAGGYGMQAAGPGTGPLGRPRGTGVSILLYVVTLGFYSLFYNYKVHEEMKQHTGRGLGGGIALLISVIVGVAMPFLTSGEVGSLYESRGQHKPVSGVTGLWYMPGILLFGIGPIIWFVKTNGALNAYWRSLGAV